MPSPQSPHWTPPCPSTSSHPLSRFVYYINATHSANLPMNDFTSLHTWSVAQPEQFWGSLATFLNFFPSRPRRVLVPHSDISLPKLIRQVWFPNARFNYAEIVLRHAKLNPKNIALVYRPEDGGDDVGYRRYVTYGELEERVKKLAGGLRDCGIRKGDVVGGILANCVDAVVCLLAATALGCVWSCCAPEFGEDAILSRFGGIGVKVLVYSMVYRYKGRVYGVVEKVRRVVARLEEVKVAVCVPAGCAMGEEVCVGELKRGGIGTGFRNVFLREFEGQGNWGGFEMLEMSDPVFCMFSSGTTGRPKCILQGGGVLLNQIKEHVLHHGMAVEDIMLFATSTGWMLFNWIVAALTTGCRVVLYDGAVFPERDEMRLLKVVREEGVTHLGAGANYFKTLRGLVGNQKGRIEVKTLKMVMATGSPSTKDHFDFVAQYFGRHVQYVSMSGGTEINGCFALGCPWKPVVAPELQCAGLGMDVCVFDESGTPIFGESGELVCRNAFPCMPLHFGDDPGHKKYRKAYFSTFGEHVWSHGDCAIHTENGGFIISGRSDSTLNPGGVRIGTSDLYHVVESLEYVENVLVAESPIVNGGSIIMFVVMNGQGNLDKIKEKEIQSELRMRLSPRHVPYAIIQVSDIPFTFSGKKCEIPVKQMLQGRQPNNRDAVKNPSAFDSIRIAIEKNGLARHAPKVTSRPKAKM